VATEPTPPPATPAAQPWFARLGPSGVLLGLGSVAGLVAAFLPLVSVSVEVMGLMSARQTAMVVGDWRGKVCLAGYIITLILAFVLYPPGGLRQKALGWAAVGAGVLVLVMAIWLLILALDTGGTTNSDVFGLASAKASVGVGAVVNVVAAAAVAAGGFLKARDEKLI